MKHKYLIPLCSVLLLTGCGDNGTFQGEIISNEMLEETIMNGITSNTELNYIRMEEKIDNNSSLLYGDDTRGVSDSHLSGVTEYKIYNDGFSVKQNTSQSTVLNGDVISQSSEINSYTSFENGLTETETKLSSNPYPYISQSYLDLGQTSKITPEEMSQAMLTSFAMNLEKTELYKTASGYEYYMRGITTQSLYNPIANSSDNNYINEYYDTVIKAELEQVDGKYRLKNFTQKREQYVKYDFLGNRVNNLVYYTTSTTFNFGYAEQRGNLDKTPNYEAYKIKETNQPSLSSYSDYYYDYMGNFTPTDLSEEYMALSGESKYLYRFTLSQNTYRNYLFELSVGDNKITDINNIEVLDSEFSLVNTVTTSSTYISFEFEDTATYTKDIYIDVLIDMYTGESEILIHYLDTTIF